MKATLVATKSLDQIMKAAERAADLTRQLLAFSRKQVREPKVINLSRAVEDMHAMLAKLIGEDIELQTIPKKRLGRIQADKGQIEQVRTTNKSPP